jgi:hypothetical protein
VKRVAAIDTGTSSNSGTACEPWIFPTDDRNDYYTKFAGHCDPFHFRESELTAAGLGSLLAAPLPPAAAVWVPAILASGVHFSRGTRISEQWAVGTQRMPVIAAIRGPSFRNLVARSSPEERAAIVAVHTWLEVGDHLPDGWNFFENQASGQLMSFDHASAMSRFFAGGPALPVTFNDPGDLLEGIPSGDYARQVARQRVLAISRPEVESLVAYFPTDSGHPWLDPARWPELVNWIMVRQPEVANVLL